MMKMEKWRSCMDREETYLISMIRYILHNKKSKTPIPDKQLNWQKLIALASRHSITNLIFYGIIKLPDDKKPEQKVCDFLKKVMRTEMSQSCVQMYAVQEMLARFEQEQIYAVALKGANMKALYPEQDMRTMNDIDILYKDGQHDQVKKCMAKMGYGGFEEGRKHDHYFRQPWCNVEMHRQLVASGTPFSRYYQDIWDRLICEEGCRYVHKMRPEDEYIYMFIHLTEHFKNGGIGIRFIMDVYVYDQKKEMDWEYIRGEMERLGLLDFWENIKSLSEIWFGERQETEHVPDILCQMERFILDNGTYGTKRNQDAVFVERRGRLMFLLHACFPGLNDMQSVYPWLKKVPVLLPAAWGIRGIRSLLFRKRNIRIQVNAFIHGDKEQGKQLREFYKQCGL